MDAMLFRKSHWFCEAETIEMAIPTLYLLKDSDKDERIKNKLNMILSGCQRCTSIFYDIMGKTNDTMLIEKLRDLEMKRNLMALRKGDDVGLMSCLIAMFRDPVWITEAVVLRLKESGVLTRKLDALSLDFRCVKGLCHLSLVPDDFCKKLAQLYFKKVKVYTFQEVQTHADLYISYIMSSMKGEVKKVPSVLAMESSVDSALNTLHLIFSRLRSTDLSIFVQTYDLKPLLTSLPHNRMRLAVVSLLSKENLLDVNKDLIANAYASSNVDFDVDEFFSSFGLFDNPEFQAAKTNAVIKNPHISDENKYTIVSRLIEELTKSNWSKFPQFFSLVISSLTIFPELNCHLLVITCNVFLNSLKKIYNNLTVESEIIETISFLIDNVNYLPYNFKETSKVLYALKDIYLFPTVRISSLFYECHIKSRNKLKTIICSFDAQTVQENYSEYNQIILQCCFLNQSYLLTCLNNNLEQLYSYNPNQMLSSLQQLMSIFYYFINQGHFYADVLLECSNAFDFISNSFTGYLENEFLTTIHVLFLNLLSGLFHTLPHFNTLVSIDDQETIDTLIHQMFSNLHTISNAYHQLDESYKNHQFYSLHYLSDTFYNALRKHNLDTLKLENTGSESVEDLQLPSIVHASYPVIPIDYDYASDDKESSSSSSDAESLESGQLDHLPQDLSVGPNAVLINSMSATRKRQLTTASASPVPVKKMKTTIIKLSKELLIKEICKWTLDPLQTALVSVPKSFTSINQYITVFKPLLLQECNESVLNSLDSERDVVQVTINHLATINDLVECQCTVSGGNVVENDLLLFDSAFIICIKKSYQGITLVLDEKMAQLHCTLNKELKCRKVASLTTMMREYLALSKVHHCTLVKQLLAVNAPSGLSVNSTTIPVAVQSILNQHNLNRSQSKAISNCIATKGFSLILGPPGTGKTSTLCALIQVLVQHGHLATSRRISSTFANTGKSPLLVCAPSNAALDELVFRLQSLNIGSLIRIGVSDQMNPMILETSLDYKVQQHVLNHKLLEDINALKLIPGQSRTTEEQKQLNLLLKEYQQITHSAQLTEYKNKLLSEADMICTTLSGSGHQLLKKLNFKMNVIIDEAAQSVEPSSLIPLQYKPEFCVLVGDHKQLPPTVLSIKCKSMNFEQSLFDRFYSSYHNTQNCSLLTTQYRMHPDIAKYISQLFYDDQLENGLEIISPLTLDAFHWYHIEGKQTGNNSLSNREEALAVVDLIDTIAKSHPDLNFSQKIGVIAMYTAQVQLINHLLRQKYGVKVLNSVRVSTVDSYQGQESDIIILSLTRSNGIGFLRDYRRMNVALSRAKYGLYIVGNLENLRQDDFWNRFITMVIDNKHVSDGLPDKLHGKCTNLF